MKTGDLARLLGVSTTTIGDWIDYFGDFFSDGAKERKRIFTESDILAAATIAKLSSDGFKLAAIKEHLANGERVDHPGVANFGVDTRMIPAAAAEQMIDASGIRTELEIVKAERDRLLEMNEHQQDKIEELQERINQLTERAARAETEARMLKEQTEKRRGWFG